MYRKLAVATAVATLAVPAVAQAHVTLQPKQATAGAFTVESVRVPNERDDASTTKVDVQFPAGFGSVSYAPKAGWKVKVTKEKLATPIKTAHGEMTEQVTRVTFTGDGKEGRIKPGQFVDFPLSFQVPDKPGATLTFKALQTYDSGEVVRWIGAPDSDEPAPTVAVMAEEGAAGGGHGAAGGKATTQPTSDASAPAAQDAAADDGKASQGLAIAALVVGALGLVLGGAAFLAGRRRAGSPAST
jgi:uncharacterized protein YcnI